MGQVDGRLILAATTTGVMNAGLCFCGNATYCTRRHEETHMRTILLALTFLCVVTVAHAGFAPCPEKIEFYKQVRESNDERVSGIFVEVIGKSGITDKKFALCESDEFIPGIFPISRNLDTFALVLPKAISIFSDDEITGLIAHEIAHTKKPFLNGGKTVELMTDLQAAEWVGSETIVMALRATLRHINRFPKWQQDLGRHSLQYRINALVYGLYEVY